MRDEEDADDLEDWEEPDEEEAEWDEEDESDTVPCPHCRRPVFETAQWCPHCENYLSREDAPPDRKPLWIVLGVLACLGIVAMWTLSR